MALKVQEEPNTQEPKDIVQGTSETWKRSLPDFPASEWTLTYYFRGVGTGIDVVATADGDDFLATISPTASNGLTVGDYSWQAYLTKDDESRLAGEGILKVQKGLSGVDAATTVESRTEIKIILDKIDAMIKGSLDKNVQEYTIGDRQLKQYTFTELLALREKYGTLYAQETQNSNDNPGPFMKARLYRHRKP